MGALQRWRDDEARGRRGRGGRRWQSPGVAPADGGRPEFLTCQALPRLATAGAASLRPDLRDRASAPGVRCRGWAAAAGRRCRQPATGTLGGALRRAKALRVELELRPDRSSLPRRGFKRSNDVHASSRAQRATAPAHRHSHMATSVARRRPPACHARRGSHCSPEAPPSLQACVQLGPVLVPCTVFRASWEAKACASNSSPYVAGWGFTRDAQQARVATGWGCQGQKSGALQGASDGPVQKQCPNERLAGKGAQRAAGQGRRNRWQCRAGMYREARCEGTETKGATGGGRYRREL